MANTERAKTRPFPTKDPDVVYRLAADRLQTQQRQIDTLDSKIGNLLGFGSALLAIVAAFLALWQGAIPCIALALLCLSGTAYVGIVVSSLFAYYARQWEAGPSLDEVWQLSREYEEKQMAWWAAESFTKSYENNQGSVKPKVLAVKVNVALVALQA